MAKTTVRTKRKKTGGDFDEVLDLVTSLNLTRDNIKTLNGTKIPSYQFIYGSELYGTLFGVFAKFEISELDDETCSVDHVTLKLFNYRGVVNIGFADEAPVCKTEVKKGKSKIPGVPEASITFTVQGLSTNRELPISISRNNPIIVSGKDPFRLVFRRMLCPLPGFDDGATSNSVKPNSLIPIPLMRNGLFDSEFCYRSGQDCYKQPIHPGMKGDKSGPSTMTFPGARCFESQVNLYYY